MANNQVRVVMSRIDRFLLSKEWDEHFLGAFHLAFPRIVLDHRPIRLSLNMVDWGPMPRFENG